MLPYIFAFLIIIAIVAFVLMGKKKTEVADEEVEVAVDTEAVVIPEPSEPLVLAPAAPVYEPTPAAPAAPAAPPAPEPVIPSPSEPLVMPKAPEPITPVAPSAPVAPVIPSPSEPLAMPKPAANKAKFIRLRRMAGKPGMFNLMGLEVYDETGVQITAGVTPTLSSQYGSTAQFGPQNLMSVGGVPNPGMTMAHTNSSENEYVQLELAVPSVISKVIIHNRTDCCSARIVNSELLLINESRIPYAQVAITAVQTKYEFDFTSPTDAIVFPKAPKLIKTVRLRRVAGKPGTFNLKGLEVYDLMGTQILDVTPSLSSQFQSPTNDFYNAKHLLSRNGVPNGVNQLAHTNNSENEYAQLVLNTPAPISKVIVHNRVDCCMDRILNSELVLVSETDGGVDTIVSTVPIGAQLIAPRYDFDVANLDKPVVTAKNSRGSITLPATNAPLTKIVRIRRVAGSTTAGIFNLRGIEVYDDKGVQITDVTPMLSSQYGTAADYGPQNLLSKSGVPNAKMAHTNNEVNAYAQIELATAAKVSKVIVHNRVDCCMARIVSPPSEVVLMADATSAPHGTYGLANLIQPMYEVLVSYK